MSVRKQRGPKKKGLLSDPLWIENVQEGGWTSGDPTPWSVGPSKEVSDRLWKIYEMMPPRESQLLRMSCEGLFQKDIAKVFKVHQPTICMRLKVALQRAREVVTLRSGYTPASVWGPSSEVPLRSREYVSLYLMYGNLSFVGRVLNQPNHKVEREIFGDYGWVTLNWDHPLAKDLRAIKGWKTLFYYQNIKEGSPERELRIARRLLRKWSAQERPTEDDYDYRSF